MCHFIVKRILYRQEKRRKNRKKGRKKKKEWRKRKGAKREKGRREEKKRRGRKLSLLPLIEDVLDSHHVCWWRLIVIRDSLVPCFVSLRKTRNRMSAIDIRFLGMWFLHPLDSCLWWSKSWWKNLLFFYNTQALSSYLCFLLTSVLIISGDYRSFPIINSLYFDQIPWYEFSQHLPEISRYFSLMFLSEII